MSPQLSVVIPTLNEEKYLPRLLMSLMAQNPKDAYEVIVVDGCSVDRTVEVAKRFSVKVFVKRSNIAEARNIGALLAKGQFIVFLDADTMVSRGFIRGVLEMVERGVKCMVFRPEPLEHWGSLFARIGYTLGWILCKLRLTNPCYMGLAVDKTVFKKLGGFDRRLVYGEDLDFLWKVSKVVKVHYPKHIAVYSSTRRWLYDGKLRLSEVFKMALRVLEYIIFHRSGMKYPVFR